MPSNAMNKSDDDRFLEAAEHQLAGIRTGTFDKKPLHERLKLLIGMGAAGSNEDHLSVFREMRDSKLVPPEESFHMIAWLLLGIAEERKLAELPPEMAELHERIRAIEREHGLAADEFWHIGQGPPEWERLNEEFTRLSDLHTALVIREHGELEMAVMYLERRAEFEALFERGRLAAIGKRPASRRKAKGSRRRRK